MRNSIAIAAAAMVLAPAWMGPATAQDIYKCADGYRQQPCPGGTPLKAADERTPLQKTQADAAARRDARLAEAMEKSRQKQEAQAVPQYTPPPRFAPADEGASAAKRPGGNGPETFRAVSPNKPGDKPKTKKKQPQK
ncbi:hypothetical protein [Ramlibacter tataouinensis]|uniref:DUF4124 domain-containing protein n=1 Tax=Ramlibacter tataouinensis (strain ATCC BAA-407 / DSM 14655 / LMG 21543 / TTB310) TaxID=365046 RepID=F5XYS7_RAMTT|nr:hypothetical protein [Ramlibacter tataouinensis]AEG94444.1 conserved hypothetical protein [Ramlibacter tataouinensis TTB310]